jgi:hypothetical protein
VAVSFFNHQPVGMRWRILEISAHASRFIVSKSVSKIVDGEVVGSKWVGAGGPEFS